MAENLLQIRSFGKIKDDFATQKDKRKAYQIFFFSAIGSIILTTAMYYITTMF